MLGFAIAWFYEYFTVNILKKDALIFLGWRLHHSLYGLICILLGIGFNKNVFLVGFGIGILVQHAITDGFWFITKEF